MKKDKRNKDISADELLEQLKEQIMLDDSAIQTNIPEPPKKPSGGSIRDALISATRTASENAGPMRPGRVRRERPEPKKEPPRAVEPEPAVDDEDEYETADAYGIPEAVPSFEEEFAKEVPAASAKGSVKKEAAEPEENPYITDKPDEPVKIYSAEEPKHASPVISQEPEEDPYKQDIPDEPVKEYEEEDISPEEGPEPSQPEPQAEEPEEPLEDLISKDAYEAALLYLGRTAGSTPPASDPKTVTKRMDAVGSFKAESETEFKPIAEPVNEPDEGSEYESADDFADSVNRSYSPSKHQKQEAAAKETAPVASDASDEYETISDDVDVDALMQKYLTMGEYDEIVSSKEKQDQADDMLMRSRIEDAEEYISSIEKQIEKDSSEAADALPISEREKAIKNMDLDDSELDATDVNLMIAFGMQDELAEKLGEENSKTVEEALEKDAENYTVVTPEKRRANDGSVEFTSREQAKDIFAAYKKDMTSIILRAAGAVVFMILSFILENSASLPSWLQPPYHVIRSMLSLQIMLFAGLLVYKPLLRGLGNLFTFKPSVESILGLLYIAGIIYHIAICVPGVYTGEKIQICNFPVMICVLITILYEYLALKREVYAFNVVSSKRKKYSLAKMDDIESAPEKAAFSEYIDEDAPMFRINRVDFVDGFFRRITEETASKTILGVLIPLCILVSFAFICAGIFLGKGSANGLIFNGINAGYLSLSLSLPFSALIAYGYPLFRASKLAHSMDSAIIGTSSIAEYSEAASISFDDKAVFPSSGAKVRSVKVYGENRIDRVIYNLTSIYNVTGGPLRDVFVKATNDIGKSDDVEIMDIADDGIEAIVSGKHMLLGRRDYIIANGFTPVYNDDDEMIEANGEASISFLICNDEVAAKIYVSYSIDPDFENILKQLRHAGICVGVKTCDPNIDDTVLSKHIELDKYPIKIIKRHIIVDQSKTEPRFESGIVSKRDPKSLLRTLSLCDMIKQSVRIGAVILSISMVIAFAIMAFLTLKNLTGGLTSFRVALYQLFWIIPTLVVSTTTVRK